MSRGGLPGRGRGSRGSRRKRFGDNGFEAWGGYMNAKKSKLEEQFSDQASKECQDAKGIFHNVAIFVNGYTDPSADELKRIMMVHGGTFHTYLSHKTTHIIAKNLPDTKVKLLKGNEPICHPRWITESLKAKKLLDFTDFLLYSAQSSSQPKLNFAVKTDNKNIEVTVKPNESLGNHSLEVDKKSARALDAKDEKFLGEFYNNSRLHHISTMGASFKAYVADLRSNESAFIFPARKKLLEISSNHQNEFLIDSKSDRVLMHIDMDCFFVSVGLRSHPNLRGLPVAVTHSKGGTGRNSNSEVVLKEAEMYESRHRVDNSEARPKSSLLDIADIAGSEKFTSMAEIASCSYEARKAGVKNGMFMGSALKLCPDLKTIPYDFEGYQEVAKTLYDTVAQYTLDIQAVSCDEMLVDLTNLLLECRIGPCEFAEVLRAEIFEATKCTASVGLGPNLLLARLATRKAKPDGVFLLTKAEAQEYMQTVSVQDLPGVGRIMARKFESLGIQTCAQLQRLSLDRLMREFGPKSGQSMYEFCRGIDSRTINFSQDRKSVSAEINYGIRFETEDDAKKFLTQLSEEVHQRMVKLGNVRGKSITLKVMVRAEDASTETAKFLGHGICDSFSRSANLSSFTNDSEVILREVMYLLRQLKVDVKDLRGLGIQVSKLDSTNCSKNEDKSSTKSILHFVKKIDPNQPPPERTEKGENSRMNENEAGPTTSRKGEEEKPKFNEISFSMLDQNVLKELPEDVQKEILEFYGNKNVKSEKDQMDPIAEQMPQQSEEPPQPGPSMRSRKPKLSYDDLSLSQLDPEVMAALPADILNEVESHFKKKPSPVKTAFDDMKNSARVEASSPSKVQTRKRGRPPKNSPRFVKKSKKVLPKTPPKAQKSLFVDEEKSRDIFDEEIKIADEKATLDGRRSIEELRPLFRAWIRSTSTPTIDDCQTVITFLRSVVKENDLELVYSALKCLARHCQSDENPGWTQCYNRIVDKVQVEMKNSHGRSLFTDFKF